MKIILSLTLEILAFIFIHRNTDFVDHYPPGWRQITLYSIGVLATIPFYVMICSIINKGNEEQTIADLCKFALAFLGSGAGTAFGYMSNQ